MVTVERVSFSYRGRKKALKDFSLHVKKGECVLLCGASGSGKSSVTKLMNGLIPHYDEWTFRRFELPL